MATVLNAFQIAAARIAARAPAAATPSPAAPPRPVQRGAHQLGAFVAHHCFINHFRFLLFNLSGQTELIRTNKTEETPLVSLPIPLLETV